ncbi:MAG: alpha/beta fold hydrolase [Pseudomonadota bacterium]
MPSTLFDGKQLSYTDSGAGEGQRDKPSLLFIHAFTCNASLWDGMIARFASRYRCLAFDLPGHGQSEPNDQASDMGLLADCAAAVLDAAGVETAHVCGLSIGGMIAQKFGLSYPERAASLTIACSTGRLAPEAGPMWRARLEAISSKGIWSQVESTMERWFGEGLMARFEPADLDPIARMIATTTVAGALSCGRAVKAHDLLDELPALTVPTLVIGGEKDLSFPASHPEALAQAIPGAKLVMLTDAGHLAPVQVPDAFEAALGDFLARV